MNTVELDPADFYFKLVRFVILVDSSREIRLCDVKFWKNNCNITCKKILISLECCSVASPGGP